MQQLESDYVVAASDPDCIQKAADHLANIGVVVIRGLVPVDDLSSLNGKVADVLSAPAICGSIGYYMKDPNKKLFDGLLLGKPSIDAFTNHTIIDVIERYLKDDIVMTEVFLKHDFGNNKVYFPYHSHTGADRKIDGGPFGCGAILYLHDTEVGAFCYCPGTHQWNSPHGSNPSKYPDEMQSKIRTGMRRVSGNRGDVVIFDSRGFHGPEQPVPQPRTTIITDYAPLRLLKDGATKTGSPVILTDLTGLDLRQLRVLGVGVKSATPYEKYHIHSFNRSRGFKLFDFAIRSWFTLMGALDPLRDVVRSLRGRRLAADVQNDG